MKIISTTKNNINPDSHEIEIVERKGIGHPDSLADILAEDFSNRYANYSYKKYGFVLNHWFDKILLSGGEAILQPGNSKILKKPTAYLFGKITKIDDKNFSIEKLFRESILFVFSSIFGISEEEIPNICVDVNSGIGADHSHTFYSFKPDNKKRRSVKLVSNDSVFCVGYAPYSKLENLVVDLENFINSSSFKRLFPQTGYDVKILAKRQGDNIDITICVPFIANKIESWTIYEKTKDQIVQNLHEYININYSHNNVRIRLNTKDEHEGVFNRVWYRS